MRLGLLTRQHQLRLAMVLRSSARDDHSPACKFAAVPITSSRTTPKKPPWAVFAYPFTPLFRSTRVQSSRNGFFLSSPVSEAGAVGLMYRKNIMHAFTVFDVLRVSLTRADSVEGIGVRSGTVTCTIDLSASSLAHQGMALKCAMGSAIGFLEYQHGFNNRRPPRETLSTVTNSRKPQLHSLRAQKTLT